MDTNILKEHASIFRVEVYVRMQLGKTGTLEDGGHLKG
jgi:hypothetical protein